MPSSTNANNLTLVHASSSGMTQWFPDACKTPTPGGPIPLPYPNIAMSTDTADGSTTVKVDGNPIMLQGSNYQMSTGDEAGSAMGVASNKIKGKAEPVNESMDVKVDGKGVFRLTDPMTHNAGSTPNGGGTPTVQPPNLAIPKTSDACKAVKDKKKAQAKGSTSWGESGIVDPHRPIIQAVATEQKVILYFRATNKSCAKWILAKHMPKPHAVLNGKTTSGGNVGKLQAWLEEFMWRMTPEQQAAYPKATSLMATNRTYSLRADDYLGIVQHTDDPVGQPYRGYGSGQSGNDYSNTWITGDYDLFQILESGQPCKEVCQTGEKFAQIQEEINKRCGWDAIQHGPQAQWEPTRDEIPDTSVPLFKMGENLKAALRDPATAGQVQITGGANPRYLEVLDKNVTQVAGNGVVSLESQEDLRKALICRECEK